jgi:hypothetical protein
MPRRPMDYSPRLVVVLVALKWPMDLNNKNSRDLLISMRIHNQRIIMLPHPQRRVECRPCFKNTDHHHQVDNTQQQQAHSCFLAENQNLREKQQASDHLHHPQQKQAVVRKSGG